MPVESVSSDPDLDLEVLAAELIAQVRSITENHRELDVGEVQQLSVTTDRLTLMVSSVAADYYLLLVLGPEGNYGRARFELRRARLLLESDLS
jgi:predicted regulator of Ras-like GTPase activity (Roadblock/LC7/MglB family)